MFRLSHAPVVTGLWWLPLVVILALALWRLLIAALLPITQDEAYYIDWAQALDWGYFDHPPGVALLGLGIWLAPASALAARLGSWIAGLLTLWVLARLYRQAGLDAPHQRALALLLAGGGIAGLASGILTTPDALLALAWALALHEGERALVGARWRWLTTGAAVGLGLMTKYSMLLIGPVFLWAILWADARTLRTPWPYLGALIALLLFAPNLLWNAQHDWLSLRFQLGHGFATDLGALDLGASTASISHSGPETWPERLTSLGGFLALQLALWGTLAPVLLILPWRTGTARTPLTPQARALFIAASLFPLGFCALLALTSSVEANWPLMYLMGAAPLLAWRLTGHGRAVLLAALANMALVGLYALHAATAIVPLPDSANRILRETHGFAELAQHAAALDAPVYTARYQQAAMLRFYAPQLRATTSQWPGLSRPSDYLRGHIAPSINPARIDTAFWLLSCRRTPPSLAGLTHQGRITLIDCPAQPLHQGETPPCRHPLHVWQLDRYRPPL